MEDILNFAEVFGDLVNYLKVDIANLARGKQNLVSFLSNTFPNTKFLDIIGDAGAYVNEVCDLLEDYERLECLRMCNCGITNTFIQELTPNLGNQLRELDLSNNKYVIFSLFGMTRH